jgi:hypothetical protein
MKNLQIFVEFQCRTGHLYSEKALDAMQQHAEDGLWTALRTIEESADLLNTLTKKAKPDRKPSADFEENLKKTNMRLKALRECLQVSNVDLEKKSTRGKSARR